RVEFGVYLSGLLLQLEQLGPMVPRHYFLCQTVLYSGFCFVNELDPGIANFCEMFRHDRCDSVTLRHVFKLVRDPVALGPHKNSFDRWFAIMAFAFVFSCRQGYICDLPIASFLCDLAVYVGERSTILSFSIARTTSGR